MDKYYLRRRGIADGDNSHELHDDAVAEFMGGCHVVDLSSNIHGEDEAVTSGCIAEAS